MIAVTGVTPISADAEENLVQLTRGAWTRQGQGPLIYLLRLRVSELTVLDYHGGPPAGIPAKTLYDLLGAHPDDDAERLKKAFRKALKANHPDLHPGDPNAPVRLSDIVRAYAILRDVEQRAAYDRWLELEREQLRAKSKRTISDTIHHALSEAIAVVVLAIALGGGYVLFAHLSKAYLESVRVADITARAPAEIATVQPAQPTVRTNTTEREEPRDKLEGVMAPSIAIAPSVAADVAKSGDAPVIAKDGPAPRLSERDVEAAKVIKDSSIPTDRADAKTSTDQLKKSDGIERPNQNQNQNMARSVGVELSSLESDKSVPKSVSGQKRGITTPDMAHGKPQAVAIRPPNHASVKQALLESKSTSACSESQYCSGKVSPGGPLAERDDPRSQAGIGFMYHRGLGGVGVDDREAAVWLRRAAEQGQAEGQLMLGMLFYHGQGVPRSFVRAYAWCELAEIGGNADAALCRDAALESMPSNVDREEAFRLVVELRGRHGSRR